MTYYDPNAQERHDRMITVYQFDGTTPVFVNLTCDGQHPQIVIDLGGSPLELELVTNDVTAIDGLLVALDDARRVLIDHQAEHAWDHTNQADNISDPNEPLYVPEHWTSGPAEAGEQ